MSLSFQNDVYSTYIITAFFCWISPIRLKQIMVWYWISAYTHGYFLFISYLPCIPVRVPQRSMGFLPVGPLIVKESVQTPVVVSTMSKLSKSSLNWHISRRLTKDNLRIKSAVKLESNQISIIFLAIDKDSWVVVWLQPDYS